MNAFKTYGKANPLKRFALSFQSAFKINPKSRDLLEEKGLEPYLPKLKKRFYFALFISLILIAPIIPGGIIAVPFVMGWGIK